MQKEYDDHTFNNFVVTDLTFKNTLVYSQSVCMPEQNILALIALLLFNQF